MKVQKRGGASNIWYDICLKSELSNPITILNSFKSYEQTVEEFKSIFILLEPFLKQYTMRLEIIENQRMIQSLPHNLTVDASSIIEV